MVEIVAATRRGPILVSWVTRVAGVIFTIRVGNCPLPRSRHLECIKFSQSRNVVTVNFEKKKKYYAKLDHHGINFQAQLATVVATLVNFVKLRDDPWTTLK